MRRLLTKCSLSILLLATGVACSQNSEQDPGEIEQDGWNNRMVFKPLFGDFDSRDPIYIRNEQQREEFRVRGAYLVQGAAACGSCHGALGKDGEVFVGGALSGGRLMEDSFGAVRAANITPDRETGIGKWNIAEIMRAIRVSIDRSGKPLSLDLHQGYRWMSDQDALAIATYLSSQPAVENQVERRELGPFERNSWGIIPQHREMRGYVPALPGRDLEARGRYLAHNVSRCYFCHTDSGGMFSKEIPFAGGDGDGSLFSRIGEILVDESRSTELVEAEAVVTRKGLESLEDSYLAKGETPPLMRESERIARGNEREEEIRQMLLSGEYPRQGPDIRDSSIRGLSDWATSDIEQFLSSGRTPGGEQIDGRLCPWPYFSQMLDRDKEAIASYLKSL